MDSINFSVDPWHLRFLHLTFLPTIPSTFSADMRKTLVVRLSNLIGGSISRDMLSLSEVRSRCFVMWWLVLKLWETTGLECNKYSEHSEILELVVPHRRLYGSPLPGYALIMLFALTVMYAFLRYRGAAVKAFDSTSMKGLDSKQKHGKLTLRAALTVVRRPYNRDRCCFLPNRMPKCSAVQKGWLNLVCSGSCKLYPGSERARQG